jgi:hypothetical protein
LYQRSGRYFTTSTPAARIAVSRESPSFWEPIQSTSSRTGTPARARSESASAKACPVAPDQKMYPSKLTLRSADRIASSIAGKAWSPFCSAVTRFPGRTAGPKRWPMVRGNWGSRTGER